MVDSSVDGKVALSVVVWAVVWVACNEERLWQR